MDRLHPRRHAAPVRLSPHRRTPHRLTRPQPHISPLSALARREGFFFVWRNVTQEDGTFGNGTRLTVRVGNETSAVALTMLADGGRMSFPETPQEIIKTYESIDQTHPVDDR